MAHCGSCGGVIGVDCFNPTECAWIGEQQEQQARADIEDRLSVLERQSQTCCSSCGQNTAMYCAQCNHEKADRVKTLEQLLITLYENMNCGLKDKPYGELDRENMTLFFREYLLIKEKHKGATP